MRNTAIVALALGLASTSVSATPIVTSNKWKRADLQGLDFEIINLARNLESLELNYWNQGLANFTDDDFNNAGYQGFRQYLELFRDQEIAHFTVLKWVSSSSSSGPHLLLYQYCPEHGHHSSCQDKEELTKSTSPQSLSSSLRMYSEAAGGGFKNCTYKFPVTTPYDLLAVGQVVTTVGEGAFIGGVANLTSSPARQTGASILGNEARQNSLLRQYLGLDYFNAVNFDTPLTASQAYSLAEPFLDCPSSNPPINFHLIPPLMANFTSGNPPHNAGDEVTIMWNSDKVYLGPDVHIQFLSDVNSIAAPLTQSSDGQGTVTLPEAINGTAILVATNFNGGGPIPDKQNFAIGYLVVA
ncbi:hypothetical protein I317_07848 [Kwoniella heveanensis CBS 569]|uniref:Rds1p n=1 Tax=Kwoniella heveanensis BCC8398 TaxID=1296120 RepID=A0A1B9GS71_9TREE|nr:hypothetical protein I316_04263 [Kwoniella heveanensis BCC8398]OCF38381.1 hypothetical protein I317_07848 [Kwoniella heveanensis CBS 569]